MRPRVPRVMTTCLICGKEFYVTQNLLDRGKGKYCSLSCLGIRNTANLSKNEYAEANPNWRGGISKDRYHYKKIQKERYPDRMRSRDVLSRAVQQGAITKLPCEVCGSENGVEAHHPDYSKPLDVKWLCNKHHREAHNGMKFNSKL